MVPHEAPEVAGLSGLFGLSGLCEPTVGTGRLITMVYSAEEE